MPHLRRLLALTVVLLAVGCSANPQPSPVQPIDRPVPGPRPAVRATVSERFYFVMVDRFANGDPSNDTGGYGAERLVSGFDPSDKGYYHGGDLQGVIDKLGYIKGLGMTAIWLTPVVTNKPVQGDSAGYHGYWGTDFTQVDPHLGSAETLTRLVDAAHAQGLKVYLDVVANHTADVITTDDGFQAYVSKEEAPYRDARGNEFDDASLAAGSEFPPVSADGTFPLAPTVAQPSDGQVKRPEWLNDPTMYHNRGDSTFEGESSLYGDFAGLDDLWTERPEVRDGMAQIYATWAASGVDGFRLDTVKHVNVSFWRHFIPTVTRAAAEAGRPNFFIFGEVYDANPAVPSLYTTAGQLASTLDFGFQSEAVAYASGGSAAAMAALFAADDHYLDADSNASSLVTFLGNHDMGRVGYLIGQGADADEQLRRVELAYELLYLSRGNPVVYYGDEQGLVGTGSDRDARQDLFATQVEEYASSPLLTGGTLGKQDRYDASAPIYRHLARLAALRSQHPALASGAHIPRYADDLDGVLAFSRLGTDEREYLVVLNNATTPRTVTVPTGTPQASWTAVYGDLAPVESDAEGSVEISVPGLSASVLRADATMPGGVVSVEVTTPNAGAEVSDRFPVQVAVTGSDSVTVTFWSRPRGGGEWTLLGSDDGAPYAVWPSAPQTGAELEVRAVARDRVSGATASAETWAVAGDPGPVIHSLGG